MSSSVDHQVQKEATDFILPPIAPDPRIKVSVAMITYNQESYIAQAIDSVLMQEIDFPIELIIGEDCSTDRTRDIVRDYQQRYPDIIRLLLPDNNQGMLRNFAQTLAACQGKYVALLEGDDYWTSPKKLQKQVNFLEQHSDCTICFHTVRCFYENDSQPSYDFPRGKQADFSDLEDLLVRNFMSTCSVVFRNRLFDQLPRWFFHLKLGDWPLHILNAQYGRIGYLREVMGAYRIHVNGLWSMKEQSRLVENTTEMLCVIDLHLHFQYTGLIKAAEANFFCGMFLNDQSSIELPQAAAYAKICLAERKIYKYLSPKVIFKMILMVYFPSAFKFARKLKNWKADYASR